MALSGATPRLRRFDALDTDGPRLDGYATPTRRGRRCARSRRAWCPWVWAEQVVDDDGRISAAPIGFADIVALQPHFEQRIRRRELRPSDRSLDMSAVSLVNIAAPSRVAAKRVNIAARRTAFSIPDRRSTSSVPGSRALGPWPWPPRPATRTPRRPPPSSEWRPVRKNPPPPSLPRASPSSTGSAPS